MKLPADCRCHHKEKTIEMFRYLSFGFFFAKTNETNEMKNTFQNSNDFRFNHRKCLWMKIQRDSIWSLEDENDEQTSMESEKSLA